LAGVSDAVVVQLRAVQPPVDLAQLVNVAAAVAVVAAAAATVVAVCSVAFAMFAAATAAAVVSSRRVPLAAQTRHNQSHRFHPPPCRTNSWKARKGREFKTVRMIIVFVTYSLASV